MQQAHTRKTSPLVWLGIGGALVACIAVAGAAISRGGRGVDTNVPGGIRMEAIRMEPGGIATARAQPLPPIPDGPMTLADASRVVSIEMYSATWCPSCGRAKAWMREQNIAFHEIDVDQRAGAMAQLQMLNPRRTLPTFDVDGEVLVGFQEPRLRVAIEAGARAARAR